jgi:hydrogenase maturation protease
MKGASSASARPAGPSSCEAAACKAEVEALAGVPASILQWFDVPGGLIYGIGNDGRQDDGLGWALIDALEREGVCRHAELHRNYQLQLEDADLIRGMRRVLFVDATQSPDVADCALYAVEPKLDFSFSSHEISAAAILATCRLCFGRAPEVWMLAIRGYEWALRMGLTAAAARNLRTARQHLDRAAQPGLRIPTPC